MKKERRLISFDEDIVDDVYRQFEGKYTKMQIKDVLRCMILYSKNLLRYTDVCQVWWYGLGYFFVNVKEAEKRLRMIDRLTTHVGSLYPNKRLEKKYLEAKIPVIKEFLKRDDVAGWKRTPHGRDEYEIYRCLLQRHDPGDVEDYQKNEFYSE